jgi:hypothetical protein
MMAVKIDTRETVPPHVAIAAGLGGKANPSQKWRISGRDVNEAEEMRFQTVASGAWPKSRS